MTSHSKARIDIGARLASSFVTFEAVRAVFAFGSAGNGFADEFSDLELGLLWEREPDARELEKVVRQTGGSDWVYQGFDEQKLSSGGSFRFSDLKVEPANWTVAVIDRIIEDVMVRFDVSQNLLMYERQATLATLQRGIVYHGQPFMEEIRRRILPYPAELVKAMIEKNLAFVPVPLLRMLAARCEVPLFYERLCRTVRSIHSVLFALNGMYHPSFKWARHYLADAAILPDSCFERLDALFDTNLPGVVETYDALAKDVFLLGARHRPEVDLSEFRSRLNEPMPVWKG